MIPNFFLNQFLQQYLRDVARFTKFKTINDVIKRYESLIVAKLDLAHKQKNDIEALQLERDIMIQLTEVSLVFNLHVVFHLYINQC